jgi:hypothetical protein
VAHAVFALGLADHHQSTTGLDACHRGGVGHLGFRTGHLAASRQKQTPKHTAEGHKLINIKNENELPASKYNASDISQQNSDLGLITLNMVKTQKI